MASGKCPHQAAAGRLICGLSKPARASSSPQLSLQWPSPPPGAGHVTFSAERNKEERLPESLSNLDSPGKAKIRVLSHSEQVLLSLQVFQVVPVVKKKKKIQLPIRRHRRPGLDPWVGKIHWRREWQLTPVVLLGKSHGQKSLADYSP